ncbi:hypothetical protein JW887_03575 [Candidatus Dojkabacteria bacterium]|nr:hypothetical protein [Candidatus Dojkabacteria bacterium]
MSSYSKRELAGILRTLDFGSSVAEQDTLLENARVETSVFTDLLNDKVDLVPGTKGSGKSALYRIFVDFLPEHLLNLQKVVIAHGVQRHSDDVFHVYNNEFEKMDENEFVNFWCVYLISLAKEHFIKNSLYANFLKDCPDEIKAFNHACQQARIPDFEKDKSLKDVLGWVLAVIRSWKPKVIYRPPDNTGEIEVNLFGEVDNSTESKNGETGPVLAQYAQSVKDRLEAILKKAGLSLWLMVDRLDEIFPRRSKLETLALRGLLRTLRIFESKEIRVKVFLRDDILEQIVSDGKGFTALTHITARQADTLRWSEEQILTMIVRRINANQILSEYLNIDAEKLEASREYQKEIFYKVFPEAVYSGEKQSSALRWMYTHTSDGRGVVTPRDVIDLLTKAKQKQQDEYSSDSSGASDFIIGPVAIRYGLEELSKRKRTTFLEAEFPHLWGYIKKFVGGGTQYNESDIQKLFGKKSDKVVEDLVSIGVLREEGRRGQKAFKIPFLYRAGLDLRQGRA